MVSRGSTAKTSTSSPKPLARRASEVTARLDVIFSLEAPPAVRIPAPELLQAAADALPLGVPKPDAPSFLSREACVMCVHAFWYSYCCLRQPGSEREQEALLKMMSQQMARLTLRLSCDRDEFFSSFPPLLAHAVLSALRKHSLITKPAQATAVLRHIVALFGCALPAKLLTKHLELIYQEAARATPGGSHLSGTPPSAPAAGSEPRPIPPLSSFAVPPMRPGGGAPATLATAPGTPVTPGDSPPPMRFASSSACCQGAATPELSSSPMGASGRGLHLGASQSAPQLGGGGGGGGGGEEEGSGLASLNSLLGIGVAREPRRQRPVRLIADLRRTSPLVAMLGGDGAAPLASSTMAGRASSSRCCNSSPSSCSTAGYAAATGGGGGGAPPLSAGPRPHYGVTLAAHVRQSQPSDRCRLGGLESYKRMRDKTAVARAAALSKQFDDTCKEVFTVDRQVRAALVEDVAKLDLQQHELLTRSDAQLSEHCSQLAARVLKRDLLTRFTPT